MIVYWIACLASVLIAWRGMQTISGRKNKWIVCALAGFPLFLVAALRFDVGSDYMSYREYYEGVLHPFHADYWNIEPLFYWLNVALAKINADPQWIFVVSAMIFAAGVFSQIFEDSPYPGLSIFLLMFMGYYFGFFNVMRQMIGCGILLYSLRYVQKRQALRFFICVAVASGFHVSCALFVFVYWVARIRIRPLMALILSVGLFAMQYLVGWILTDLVSWTRYSIYITSIYADGKTAYVMLAINAVLLIFAYAFGRDDPRYRMYSNLQLINLWVIMLSGRVVLILRLMWMFGLPSVILVPMALSNIKDTKKRRILMILITVLYFIYSYYTVGIMNSNQVLPYKTIFSR